MAAATEERVVETTSADDPFDPWHVVCHCSDNNTAWCGLDVTDKPYNEEPFDEDDPNACLFCKLVMERLDGQMCPWGCTCIDECADDFPEDEPEPDLSHIRGHRAQWVVIDECKSDQ